MKTDVNMCRGRRRLVSAWIDRRVLLVLGLLAVLAVAAYSAAPSWWAVRGTHNGKAANDYAVANQGQLKNMAKAARDEMVDKGHFSEEEDNAINNMVNGWYPASPGALDYAPINLGQLKAVAAPFYDVLRAHNVLVNYPWSTTIADDLDYGVANIGQLKRVFSFAVSEAPLDSDGDGLPDDWEIARGLDPNDDADAGYSLNRGGPTMLQNYQRWAGLDPNGNEDGSSEVGTPVPNYKDADPFNASIGVLTITIDSPDEQESL